MQGIHAYRQTQVASSSPLELVVMLYDGVFRFLAQAREAIERRDIPARRDALDRALAILGELQTRLNVEEGGETALTLDRLYTFATRRLLDAASHNDVAAIDEVRRLLEPVRQAWGEIASPVAETPVTPATPAKVGAVR